MLTLREIFNKVSNHLLTQKVRATGPNGCSYRVGDLKCAVGCLISDETYDPSIEGCVPSTTMARIPESETARRKLLKVLQANNVDAMDEATSALLLTLQRIHDEMSPEVWAFELGRIELVWFPIEEET